VLYTGAQGRHLWQFNARNGEVALAAEQALPLERSLPPAVTRRGWRDLWQPKLNVAWLPADRVYLRVIHVPRGEASELRAMLELQLEKLSPAPVNQIVWTFQPVVHPSPELQTAVVVIAERADVESFLGALEKEGYLADRLELPWLHQIVTAPPEGDTTWIYLVRRDPDVLCLAAWWYAGALQHLDLLRLPSGAAGPAMLSDHLSRITWSGQLDAWLTHAPRWRVVMADLDAQVWDEALRAHLGEDLTLMPGPSGSELAAVAARRSLQAACTANLLPAESAARYRQQYVDLLWMRGLGAVVLAYVLGVLIYLSGVQVLEYQKNQAQEELRRWSGAYTNALQLKDRLRVFEEQAQLRFAALDCLRVATELLPPELTLSSFTFQGGRSVRLTGTVPAEHQERVTEYNNEIRRASLDHAPLFKKEGVTPPKFTAVAGVGFRWDFTADLQRALAE
jgi:hypothetical protein